MMKFRVKSLIALCATSLTLLLTSTKSDATVNMKLLTYVAKSCQKDVVSNDYYQKMEIDINNGLVGKQDLEFCIQHRYHYSSIIYQFPWLNSAGEIMAGYPASVVIKNLAAFPYNINIGLIDCLASQDASSRECETTYSSIGIVGENKIMIYVCPSCFVVYNNNISGSRKEILQGFIQWFLALDKSHRRDIMSILGDDSKAVQLRHTLMNESGEAAREYQQVRAKVEQQEREQRRRELLEGKTPNSAPSKLATASITEQVKFLNGTWVGTYTCAQGLTNMNLVIETNSTDEIDAIFTFSPHSSNPSVPSGSFRMKGTYKLSDSSDKPSELYLKGTTWIDHPNNYITIDLSGNVLPSVKKIVGNVITPNCSTFEVSKIEKY